MEPTIKLQIKLLKLCNKKKMNFEIAPKHGVIHVLKFDDNSEFLFREYCYIDNKNAIENINGLIKKVKNYK